MNSMSNVRGRMGSMRLPMSWLGGMLPNLGVESRTGGMRARVDMKPYESPTPIASSVLYAEQREGSAS